jgi:hypothetical protein
MIDALRLTLGWGVAWLVGIAIVAALLRATLKRDGTLAWTIGCGYFAGAFVVTAWMRVLSFAGIAFSIASIALPLVIATAALAWYARPAWRATSFSNSSTTRGERWVIYGVATWLAVRFVVLLLDVLFTPLYPWDAWIQWATKARVWYALGHIVPFARSDAWFAANGALWFDASPNYPATVPLWQVWSSVALGRWDDALMNLPWWLTAVAFAVAIFGALRESGMRAPVAIIGAWIASSLPLANVHVALAGYADLPMAAYYALAAVAAWRWTQDRTFGNAVLALMLAIACVTIKTPGVVWAATLVPGVVLALLPRHGPRIVAIGLAAVLLVLAVLAQTDPVVLGYRLHLDFAPAWQALIASLFLLGNWHLAWYVTIAATVIGWKEIRAPALAPLSVTVGAGALFLLVAFAFTNARNWVSDQTTINRALLHLVPLALVWTMLVLHAWYVRQRSSAATTPVVVAA